MIPIIFAGTPGLAGPILEALHQDSRFDIRLILTTPDVPRGRKRVETPSELALKAEELGLGDLVFKGKPTVEVVEAAGAQLGVVVAYRYLLTPALLEALPLGWVNTHFSMLPRWRGAAPVQRGIEAGDSSTGVSVFQLVEELDAGPVFWSAPFGLNGSNAELNSGEVLSSLAELTAAELPDVLDRIASGRLEAVAQNSSVEAGFEYAAKFEKSESELDFAALTAKQLHNKVRAFNPAPGVWFEFNGQRLSLTRSRLVTDVPSGLEPGSIRAESKRLFVETADGALEILELKPAGKNAMPAAAWINGNLK